MLSWTSDGGLWCRVAAIRGELNTVITFELIFSPIPTFGLILVASAFFWYLSWARRVRVAPARAVADRHTHKHYEYCNLAPAWARLITIDKEEEEEAQNLEECAGEVGLSEPPEVLQALRHCLSELLHKEDAVWPAPSLPV